MELISVEWIGGSIIAIAQAIMVYMQMRNRSEQLQTKEAVERLQTEANKPKVEADANATNANATATLATALSDSHERFTNTLTRMTDLIDKRETKWDKDAEENRQLRQKLEKDLADSNADKEEMRTQIRDLAVQSGKQDKQIELLQKSNDDFSRVNREQGNEIIHLKAQILDLQKERDREISSRDKEIKELNGAVSRRDKRIEELEELEDKVKHLEAKVKDLEASSSERQATVVTTVTATTGTGDKQTTEQ